MAIGVGGKLYSTNGKSTTFGQIVEQNRITFPSNYPSMSMTTEFAMMDRQQALNKKIAMEKMEHSPIGGFVGIGQGLTYAPEAAALVFVPEFTGAKVSNYLFKAQSFARKINLGERTLGVGMNYIGQSIGDRGDIGFSSKDQIGLAVSFFSAGMGNRASLGFGLASSQFSWSQKDGFGSPLLEGNFGLAGIKALASGLGTGISQNGFSKSSFVNQAYGAIIEGQLNASFKKFKEFDFPKYSLFKDFGKPSN